MVETDELLLKQIELLERENNGGFEENGSSLLGYG
jgi:hypothetical protein